MVISDTVGFIRKLPHQLVEAFKATLEELSYADLLLHVIDASNPLWREQAAVVEQLIVELGAEQTPRIDVFNKCDKFTGDILPHGADIVSISAKTGQGLDELLEKNEVLAEFKAVQEGNVWCTGQDLFQSSMGLGDLLLDIHTVLTQEDPEPGSLTYLYRLTREG